MEQQLDGHVLLEEVPTVSQMLPVKRQLLVGRRVHEGVLAALHVEKGHLPLVEIGCGQLFPRAVGPFDDVPGPETLELGPYEGSAFPGLDVLKFDDRVGLSIQLELRPVAKFRR
jgi:hypothetical protein